MTMFSPRLQQSMTPDALVTPAVFGKGSFPVAAYPGIPLVVVVVPDARHSRPGPSQLPVGYGVDRLDDAIH